ncbi:MAG: hypothetical protein GAK31_00354 [Stenotrophomonas maltophilia]|uniref:TonB-dependent receptor-like beta-barrel domain-containing protein n=1 Tax=Stenotrophomonas maltophilia TaxID=40324 RepID=A0A7V8JN57_STEMA|nr:MAG: hypothetical protein GAK31_00354 [Stenotrophomonas maltophilia]
MELTGALMPLDGLRLSGSLTYTDATLTSPIPPVRPGGPNQAETGARLPQVPEWTGSLQADYQFPSRGEWAWSVGGALRYYGVREASVAAAQSIRLPNYTTMDLTAEVSNQNTTFRLFVTNLTNKDIYVAAGRTLPGPGAGDYRRWNAVMLQPRTIGVSVDYSF